MGSAEKYVCKLDEASLKKAREELNEDPADRMNAVEAFRNLIKTRAPHIRCSMGKCVRVRVSVCVCRQNECYGSFQKSDKIKISTYQT